MDTDPTSAAVTPRAPVSAWDALLRAATGLGVALALLSWIGLIWRETLELALILLIVASMQWVHGRTDRHSTPAIAAAGVLAICVGAGAALLLRHTRPESLHTDIACAAFAALVGSQIYAAITRRP